MKLPRTKIDELQRLLDSFVWEDKKSRFRSSILQQPKQDRSVGLPNVSRYYYAAQVEQFLMQ